jgi:hypothetical protein
MGTALLHVIARAPGIRLCGSVRITQRHADVAPLNRRHDEKSSLQERSQIARPHKDSIAAMFE